MSNFYQNDQNVGQQQNAGRDNIRYYLDHPFAIVKDVFINVTNLFQGAFPKTAPCYFGATELSGYQQKILEIEFEKLELKKQQLEDEDQYKSQLLQLKKSENILLREKFEHEQKVVQEKLELTKSYYLEDIGFRKKELQDKNDFRYSNLQVNRDSTLEILSQRSGNLFVIPSPLKISVDDLPASKSFSSETIYKTSNYINGIREKAAYAGISCENIFRGPIDNMVAKSVGQFLAPIPTLIFHTEIVHSKILMQVTVTCPEIRDYSQSYNFEADLQISDDSQIEFQASDLQSESSSKFISKSYQTYLPELTWRDYKENLETQDKSPEEIDQAILNIVSSAHLVAALCFCDLYCFQLNPIHSPQLFEYLSSSEFPDFLRPWAEYFRDNLEAAQRQIQEELNRIRSLQEERQSFTHYHVSEDLNIGQIAVFGVWAFFLLLVFIGSQPSSNTFNSDGRNSIENSSKGLFIVVKDNADANVRTGPSDGYPTILTVPSRFEASVKSIDEVSGWIEIDMSQHHPLYQTGWIAGYLVDLYQMP